MKLRRKISLLVVGALAAATLALASASPALAAGRISSTGNCGDLLDMRVKNVGDDIDVGITIPSIDSTEVWSLSATEQLSGADTGGRHGNPINLTSSGALPPLVFNAAEGGFASSGAIANTDNATTGISYTATRTSPSRSPAPTRGSGPTRSAAASGRPRRTPPGVRTARRCSTP